MEMKIKNGFVLIPTMGQVMVIATGDLAGEFKGMIKLNETSADIWRWIDEGFCIDDIVSRYMETYSVDREAAVRDVDAVVKNMQEAGVFEC